MNDAKATKARAANSLWLTLFLLLTCGFTPVLMAQSRSRTIHVFVALAAMSRFVSAPLPLTINIKNAESRARATCW